MYLFIFHNMILIKVILIFGRNNFQNRCYVFLDAALLRKFVRSNHVSKRAVVIFMHAYYFSYQNMIMVSEYSVLVEKVGVNGVEFHLLKTESNPLLIFSIIIQMTSIMILEHLIPSHTNLCQTLLLFVQEIVLQKQYILQIDMKNRFVRITVFCNHHIYDISSCHIL